MVWLAKTKIEFNKKLRTTLGRAHPLENRIELNPTLIESFPHELKPTLAHEFAHLVAPLLYGRQGGAHQWGWQKVMNLLGYEPERTHRLPVEYLKRTHRVSANARCGCADLIHEIKPRRYRKMRYGRTRYKCLTCNEELILMSSNFSS